MNFQTKLIIVFVFYLSINEILSFCPKPDLIKPCYCNANRIMCFGNGYGQSHFDQIFERLEKHLSADEKHFEMLHLSDQEITELKENQFRDITFDDITIYQCSKLKTIHKNVFDHTSKVTSYISFRSNPLLDVSIFNILKKFINVQYIDIFGTDLDAIPSNAFDVSQVSLRNIWISESNIKNIENNAFSNLANITTITLVGSTIQSFEENAFHFDQDSDIRLKIRFDSELYESSTSTLSNALLKINRPVEIIIDQVDYLDENIFSSFLSLNPKNRISSKFVDCKDSRNEWFMNNTQLSPQVAEFSCSHQNHYDIHSDCPRKGLLRSCNCYYNRISCTGNQIKSIDEIFEKLESKLKPEHKHFQSIHFYNTMITEFKENQFRDITFGEISITDCKQLKTIHENAFSGSEQNIGSFNLISSPGLVFTSGSIFDILSKFENVRNIKITDANIETIPTNAFKSNQLNLVSIVFNGTTIKAIEDNAFSSLKKLSSLSLINTSIELIPENALKIEDNPKKDFYLHLISNHFINSSDFESQALLVLKRYRVVVLILNDQDPVSYLKENFYQPFLTVNPKNIIGVNVSFDCNDCRNVWLQKNPDLLPQIYNLEKEMYERQSPLACSNGKLLNDTEIFTTC